MSLILKVISLIPVNLTLTWFAKITWQIKPDDFEVLHSFDRIFTSYLISSFLLGHKTSLILWPKFFPHLMVHSSCQPFLKSWAQSHSKFSNDSFLCWFRKCLTKHFINFLSRFSESLRHELRWILFMSDKLT